MTVLLIDTNVVVAGVLANERESPTARILYAMLAAALPFLISVELLAEYRSVLLRPKVRRHHDLGDEEVDAILEELAFHGILRLLSDSFDPPTDTGDAHLFALLAAEPGAILVSGGHRTVAEVLKMARRPVISSHGGVQATCKTNRNLSDAEIRGIARTGGVIGIGYWAGAICSTDPRSARGS